jgi:hypothetical protein
MPQDMASWMCKDVVTTNIRLTDINERVEGKFSVEE